MGGGYKNIYLHLTLLLNILIPLFVFIVFNTLILRLEARVNALGRYGFIYLNFFKMYLTPTDCIPFVWFLGSGYK